MAAWAGVVATAIYLLNAFFGERLERRWAQLVGAVLFAGSYWGIYEMHGAAAVYTFYTMSVVGVTLWLWSMYVYIPQNYPTRLRSLGTGWTDGVGHLGAWGGVLIAGALFTVANPRALLRVRHDPVRGPARSPDRGLREEPAPPHARGAVPIAAGPPARVRPPALSRGVSGGTTVSPAAQPSPQPASRHSLSGGRPAWRTGGHPCCTSPFWSRKVTVT